MNSASEAKLTARIDSMCRSLDALDSKIGRLDSAIRGNSKAGVLTRLAVLTHRVNDFDQILNEFKAARRWVTCGIVALFGSLAWQITLWYLASA